MPCNDLTNSSYFDAYATIFFCFRELLRSGQVHLDIQDLLNDIMNHPEEEEERAPESAPTFVQQSIGSSSSTGRVQNNISITGGNFTSSILPG